MSETDETMTEREFECIQVLVNLARRDGMTKTHLAALMKQNGYSKDEVQTALSKITVSTS